MAAWFEECRGGLPGFFATQALLVEPRSQISSLRCLELAVGKTQGDCQRSAESSWQLALGCSRRRFGISMYTKVPLPLAQERLEHKNVGGTFEFTDLLRFHCQSRGCTIYPKVYPS